VRSLDSEIAGHKVIAPTLAGCALTEHWNGAGGSVRQHWESSSDDSAIWTTLFDGRYLTKR